MADGRIQSSGLVLGACLALLFNVSSAAVSHTVGDATGWTVPPSSSFYAAWASRQTFHVGDFLVFNFESGKQSVAEVTKPDYESCATATPLIQINNGPANLTISSPSTHYYISTVPGHCAAGQKLLVTATPLSPPSPVAPTPKTTVAPAPKTTPPAAPTPKSPAAPAPKSVAVPTPTSPAAATPTPSATTTPGSSPAAAPSSETPTGSPEISPIASGPAASPSAGGLGASPSAGGPAAIAGGPAGGAAGGGSTVPGELTPAGEPAAGGSGSATLGSGSLAWTLLLMAGAVVMRY